MLHALGLKRDANREAALQLLAAATAAARAPGLYGPGRAPDTFDGRFQMLALHAILLHRRLKSEPPRLAQAFSDALFQSFDEGLREAGVGDLSVPKHMKKIARAFYGRVAAYDSALSSSDAESLAGALARNVWDADAQAAPFAPALAAYARAAAARLADAPLGELAGPGAWPPSPAA